MDRRALSATIATALFTTGAAEAIGGIVNHIAWIWQLGAVSGVLGVATWGILLATTTAKKVAPLPRGMVALPAAGQWLYDRIGDEGRSIMAGDEFVPSLFPTVADHAATYFIEAAAEGFCTIYGRREAGLMLEKIDPSLLTRSPHASLFPSKQRPPVDLCVRRPDLRKVLKWYRAN